MTIISSLSPSAGAFEFMQTQLLPPLMSMASGIGKAILSGASMAAGVAITGAKSYAGALITPYSMVAALGAALMIGAIYLAAHSLSSQIESDIQEALSSF